MAKSKVNLAAPAAYDDAKWRAEDDLRTLTRAAEISADRSRVNAAKKVAQQQISSLTKVAGVPAKGSKPAPHGAAARLAGKRI